MPEFKEVTIGQCRLIHGDNLEVLPTLEESSVDTIITDPPYGLSFMGRNWDHGIPGVEFWKQALRVAKPGAMMLVFGGTRTFHRIACAIEDAGWEIRDTIMWVYGSGFPKSLDISKSIDKSAGVERTDVVGVKPGHEGFQNRTDSHAAGGREQGWDRPWKDDAEAVSASHMQYAPATDDAREWDGWGTALKPSWEPILVCMKPLDGTFANNAIKHGVAGFNIDAARIPLNGDFKCGANGRPSQTGLGDNYDPKRANQHSDVGRFPANLIHDGSAEVIGLFPAKAGAAAPVHNRNADKFRNSFSKFRGNTDEQGSTFHGDSGSAARFFYAAKASKSDRGGAFNTHPTVKPLSLMEYLCKLTSTPTGGTVLDMFMGSGSTGVACVATGRKFIGIELNDTAEEPFFTIAGRRVERAQPAMRSLFDNEL